MTIVNRSSKHSSLARLTDRCEYEQPLDATGETSVRCNAPCAEMCACGYLYCDEHVKPHRLHDCSEVHRGETLRKLESRVIAAERRQA